MRINSLVLNPFMEMPDNCWTKKARGLYSYQIKRTCNSLI